MTDLGTSLDAIIDAAPEAAQQPALALGVAQDGGNIQGNAQAAMHAANGANMQQAINNVAPKVGGHKSLWDRLVGDAVEGATALVEGPGRVLEDVTKAVFPGSAGVINQVERFNPIDRGFQAAGSLIAHPSPQTAVQQVGPLLGMANKPLQTVQHEYRYLKDVEERHGWAAVFPAALAIGAGSVAGGAIGGGEGAVLGGEAAGLGAGLVLHRDSWDATGAPGYVDPQSGLPVSPGQDVAGLLRQIPGVKHVVGGTPNPKSRDALSGVLDGVFDLAADPVAKAAGFYHETLSSGGAGGWLGHQIGGMSISNIDQAATRPAFSRVLDQVAATDSASQIAGLVPNWEPIAPELARASTPDEVVQVLKNVQATVGLLDGALPTQTIVQGVLRGAGRRLLDVGNLGDSPAARMFSLVPTALNRKTLELSSTEFDHSDNNLRALYRTARFALDRQTSRFYTDAYAAIDPADTAARKLAYRSLIEQVLIKAGVPTDHPFLTGIRREITDLQNGVADNRFGEYGFDMQGNNLSSVWHAPLDRNTAAALWLDQTSTKDAFPNFMAVERAVRGTNSWTKFMGGADDWLYSHWTQTVFKPLALLSMGFGFRVAAAEAIPNTLRFGLGNMIAARLAATAVKGGIEIGDDEMPHLTSAVGRLVAKVPPSKLERMVNYAVDLTTANGSHILAPGVDAANHVSAEFSPVEKYTNDLYKGLLRNAKVAETGEFASFGPGQGSSARSHADLWQTQLHNIATDPGGRLIARSYLQALRDGATTAQARDAAIADHLRWWNPEPQLGAPDLNAPALASDNLPVRAGLPLEPVRPREIFENGVADDAYKKRFIRNVSATVEGQDPAQSISEERVKAFQGLTHTPELTNAHRVAQTGDKLILYGDEPIVRGGDPHIDVIRQLANGETPTRAELDAIEVNERPLLIPGRHALPVVDSAIRRVADVGFRHAVDPVINFISREPVYLNEFANQMDMLAPFEEQGLINHAEAVQVAQTRAVVQMMPFVHNTLERSQFAQLARNIMPFYFAQEQSYKRFGRLLADDPAAFRKYQLILSSMANIGTPSTDNQGNNFVTLPGTGWLGKEMPTLFGKLGIATTFGGPAAFSGNLKSLSSVFPFTEDINPLAKAGPVVTIPTKAIAALFPRTEPAIASIIGTQADQASMWDQVIPNATITRVLQAIPPFDQAHSFVSATNQILQTMEYRQQVAMDNWIKAGHQADDPGHPQIIPDDVRNSTDATNPRAWSTFIDRVRNQARILFLMKAAIGTVSPLAPTINVGDLHLKAELQTDIKQQGLTAGLASFLEKNPDATAYTVGLSANASGASISPTKNFQDFINANGLLYDKYSTAALWVAPQDPGNFDPAIYSEQMRMHLRQEKAPDKMLDDLLIAEGNKDFYNEGLPAYEAARAAALGMSAQYNSARDALKQGNSQSMAVFNAQAAIAARGHNPQLVALSNALNQQVQAYGQLHPVWYKDYLDQTGEAKVNREQIVNNLRQMFADGAAPNNTQASGIRSLLTSLDIFLAEINPSRYPTGRVPTLLKDQAVLGWQQYLNDVGQAHPELANVIARVFRKYQG